MLIFFTNNWKWSEIWVFLTFIKYVIFRFTKWYGTWLEVSLSTHIYTCQFGKLCVIYWHNYMFITVKFNFKQIWFLHGIKKNKKNNQCIYGYGTYFIEVAICRPSSAHAWLYNFIVLAFKKINGPLSSKSRQTKLRAVRAFKYFFLMDIP